MGVFEKPAPDGLGGRFGAAMSWSYVSSVGRTGMTLLVSLVLARLLGPEVFGLIAMANVYIFFVELLARQGLLPALIQRSRLTPEHLDTAFWTTASAVAVLTPVSMLLSGPWAAVNGLPDLQAVIIGLSPVLTLKGLSIVQMARLHRRMDFRTLAFCTNGAVFVGAVVGLSMAWAGAGVWALVGQQLAVAVVESLAVWLTSDWRPSWRFRREALRDLWSFSAHATVASLGGFLGRRADALLIGLFFGPVAVGLYRMAARLVETALEVAVGGLQSVTLPELSRRQHDREGLSDRAVELVRMGAGIASPIFLVLLISSDHLMAVLGPEWEAAAAPLKILSILAAFQVAAALWGPMLQAAGRPAVQAKLAWLAAALAAVSFSVAGFVLQDAPTGTQVLGLALATLVTRLMSIAFVSALVIRRSLGIRPSALFSAVWSPLRGAVLGAAVGWALVVVVGDATTLPDLLRLGLTVSVGGVLSVAGTLLVDKSLRSNATTLLEHALTRGARTVP